MAYHLRPFQLTDVDPLFEFEREPEMVRYQDFPARTRENAAEYVRSAMTDGGGYVERVITDDGRFLGRVGAHVDPEGTASLWYSIPIPYQRRGLAMTGVGLLLEVLRTKGVERVRIECHPENVASMRIAEKLGLGLKSLQADGPDASAVFIGALESCLVTCSTVEGAV
jgi:RimJ/RimL family protein N-acetyltransferase